MLAAASDAATIGSVNDSSSCSWLSATHSHPGRATDTLINFDMKLFSPNHGVPRWGERSSVPAVASSSTVKDRPCWNVSNPPARHCIPLGSKRP